MDWHRVLGPLAGSFDRDELLSLDAASRQHPRRAIRLAPWREPREVPLPLEPVPWFPAGFFVNTSEVRPGELLHYAAGDYYIQDAGSMLPLALAEIEPGQSVCDTCAAPGGKATGVLEQLLGTGTLVANEVIGSRLGVLQSALARTGYSNYLTMSAGVEELPEVLGENFDCVIVDAPCTGQTMVGRGKQSLAAYSAAQIEHSAARQRRIVRDAARLVAPGGRLVYSTCAFSFQENEEIVHGFLSEHPGWLLKTFARLEAWQTPGYPGCYRVWPHRDGSGGAFAAALVRQSGAVPGQVLGPVLVPASARSKPSTADGAETIREFEWLLPADQHVTWKWRHIGKAYHAFDDNLQAAWLHRAIGGIALAERQSDRWEPHHTAAVLRGIHFRAQHNIELDDIQAARYVAGEALPIATDTPGWTRVWWRQRPLGWGKAVGRILKNHYPKALRQRQHA